MPKKLKNPPKHNHSLSDRCSTPVEDFDELEGPYVAACDHERGTHGPDGCKYCACQGYTCGMCVSEKHQRDADEKRKQQTNP